LTEIDAGIVSDVSVGFTAKRGENIVDEAGREMSARRLMSPGEALEGSLVWLGAQPGARAVKSAKTPPENEVDIKELFEAAKAANTTLQSQLDAAAPSHDIVVKARAALGEHAHLLDKPELLGETAKAAASYRASLIDDIVAGERAAGMCGDTDEAVAAAKSFYAGSAIDALESRAKAARDRAGKSGTVTPSNPNAPAPKVEEGNKGAPALFTATNLI
jgi:hypothetical protein